VPNGGRSLSADVILNKGTTADGKKRQVGLANAVKMWPTPRAEFDSGGHRGTKDTLHSAVKLWPTPSANEDAAGTPSGKMQKMLGNHPAVRESGSGSLNPRWVEWLMGFSDGHTALEPSEMPSSRSKRTRSSEPSPTSKE
jgi:hypothetical protein